MENPIKPSEISSSLQLLTRIRKPAFLWGAPGVGKSQLVGQVAAALGLRLIDIRAILLDPVDLRGCRLSNTARQPGPSRPFCRRTAPASCSWTS